MHSHSGEQAPLSVFLLGGCDIHGPLDLIARAGQKIRRPAYGHVPFTFTFGEMFQTIEVLRGKKEIPEEIRPLCLMDDQFVPVARSADFEDVDLFLVEPASSIDLVYHDCSFNRIPLSNIVLQPLRQISKDASKYANHWLRAGLVGQDDEKRLELAESLIALMPKYLDNFDFIKSVLLETRARKNEVLAALTRLQNVVGRPIGIVSFIFRFLADGRAVSWPAGHQEEILAAARARDLPVFDPAPVVREYGVEKALKPELSHYVEEFDPLIGDRLADFACMVHQRARGSATHVRQSVRPEDMPFAN